MKILYIPTLNLACGYFRVEAPAAEIVRHKEHGVYVEYMNVDPETKIAWERVLHSTNGKHSINIRESLISAFKQFDVIITQKLQDKRTLPLLIKLKTENPYCKLILDVDDSMTHSSQTAPVIITKEFIDTNIEYARFVDGIITTTNVMRDELLKYNNNVYVMPNFIRPQDFKFKKVKNDTEFKRIGYVGAAGHSHDLEAHWDEYMSMLENNPDWKLVIRLSDYKPDFIKDHPQVDYDNLAVHFTKYPQAVNDLKIDVFIAPLRDLYFNRCKSELKVVEALFFGNPIVASNIKTFNNNRLEKHKNKQVFFANKGEWEAQIKRALEVDGKRIKLNYPRNIVKEMINWIENIERHTPSEPIYGAYKYKWKILEV